MSIFAKSIQSLRQRTKQYSTQGLKILLWVLKPLRGQRPLARFTFPYLSQRFLTSWRVTIPYIAPCYLPPVISWNEMERNYKGDCGGFCGLARGRGWVQITAKRSKTFSSVYIPLPEPKVFNLLAAMMIFQSFSF